MLEGRSSKDLSMILARKKPSLVQILTTVVLVLLALGACTSSTSSDAAGCDATGTWDVQFQWSGRTPGVLEIVVASDMSALVPAGPGVTEDHGKTSVKGDQITWTFNDESTYTGLATSSCTEIADGLMVNAKGTTGRFSAKKQDKASSGGGGGGGGGGGEKPECSNNSDCSSQCSDCPGCRSGSCKCGRRAAGGGCIF